MGRGQDFWLLRRFLSTKKIQSFKALVRNAVPTLPGCCCKTPENPLWGWKGLGSSIYLSIC